MHALRIFRVGNLIDFPEHKVSSCLAHDMQVQILSFGIVSSQLTIVEALMTN